MSEKIIAYKAMGKNMKCRGKQYEVGKTYYEGKADCCHAGMHACENPLDVLRYYHVSNGVRFFQVECGGEADKSDEDSKLACTEMTVKGELKLTDMLKIGVEAVMKRVKEKTAGAKKLPRLATTPRVPRLATTPRVPRLAAAPRVPRLAAAPRRK